MLSPKMASMSPGARPSSSQIASWSFRRFVRYPRGKKLESVPKISRSAPIASIVSRNRSARVGRWGSRLVQLFDDELSMWTFWYWAATISASRKNPAPKCGMIQATDGKRSAGPARSSGLP